MIDFDKRYYYYDEKAAGKVISFIETFCCHIRGDLAGHSLILADFWKEDIIKPVFGIRRKSNGKRRFKTVYVEIGKGNAKSTVGSAIALYLLGFDNANGAEVYSVAGDTQQARIIFDTAKFMVSESDYLKQKFQVYQYSIIKKQSANFYKVISAEAHTKHGYNPSGIIFDELHVQPTRDLWDTLTAGQMKRDESLCFAFTTAGFDKQSICWELHQKSVAIKNGDIKDDSFLGIIYTAPDKDDIADPVTWRKANPGLGTIISMENLQIEFNKVLASPSYEDTFRRLHLNQWTEHYQSWLKMNEINDCNLGGLPDDNIGKECYAGLDLAATRDFNALALLFPVTEESANVLVWFWIPADMIDQRMRKQTIDFEKWVREGLIKKVPGNAVDHNVVLSDIIEIFKNYNVIKMGYDRKFASTTVVALSEIVECDPIDQTMANISYPTVILEKMIVTKKLNHYGNPVLTWQFSNAAVYRGENDMVRITKKGSSDKIDGVFAILNAVAEWESDKMKPTGSVYDDPGHELIAF